MLKVKDGPKTDTAARLVKVLGRLRDLHLDMSINQAMTLFHVAQYPGITQRALYEALGVSDSVASRALAVLSEFGTRNTAGLDLVVMQTNENDRRERLLYLTPKGKRLIDDILKDLG